MRTLGLIGGTSYISTIEYYRMINEAVNQHLGSNNAARLILYSLNLAEAVKTTEQIGWNGFADELSEIAVNLKKMGAEGLLLCANTLHMAASKIKQNIDIPIIHIAESTAREIQAKDLSRVGLLGTRTTMEATFYRDLLRGIGISVVIPDKESIDFLQDAIYNELTIGLFKDETVSRIKEIGFSLEDQGVEGLILGCTELPLIIKQQDTDLKLFNTLKIHVDAAVKFMLDL